MSPPKHSASSPRPGSFRGRLHSTGTPTEKESPLHYEENLSSGQRPSTGQTSGPEPVRQEGPPQQQHDTPTEEVSPDQGDGQQPTTPRSSVRPFFTLIKDTNTSRYYHPEVRYIFSDDDTDALTEAALRSLESQHHDQPEQQQQQQRAPPSRRKQQRAAGKEDDDRPPEERYIVIDMEPVPEPEPDPSTGGTEDKSSRAAGDKHPSQQRNQEFNVTSANSLTPSWAVLDARLSAAPAFDNSSTTPPNTQDNQDSPVGGLMLKVEGTSSLAGASAEGVGAGGPRQPGGRHQTMEEMMEHLRKNMDDLKRVVEASDPVSEKEEEAKEDEPKAEEQEAEHHEEGGQEEQQEEHRNE